MVPIILSLAALLCWVVLGWAVSERIAREEWHALLKRKDLR